MKLDVRHITKHYASTIALQDVSFTLENGIYALLGANGSGKTTLIKIMVDLIQATDGDVWFDEKPIQKQKEHFLSMLGYMPQNIQMYPTFRVAEFLTYMGTLKGLKPSYLQQQIKRLLEDLHLTDVSHKRIKALSGGMRQRLGLAQSLLNDPRVLILDEPSVGLDPKERNSFKNHLARLGTDRIILLSTHIVEDVDQLCKEIIILKQGKLAFKGTQYDLEQQCAPLLYEALMSKEQLQQLRQSARILHVQPTNGQYTVRFLTEEECPLPHAVPALQDAYLHYFQEMMDNDETCQI